jgi:hypothetical protein
VGFDGFRLYSFHASHYPFVDSTGLSKRYVDRKEKIYAAKEE